MDASAFQLYYSNEVVQNLKALYKELFKKEEAEEEKAELREEPEKEVEWNLSVQEVEDVSIVYLNKSQSVLEYVIL